MSPTDAPAPIDDRVGWRWCAPPQLRLSATEERILRALVEASDDYVPRSLLQAQTPSGLIMAGPTIVSTHVTSIRRKLKPFGATIDTQYGGGGGYRIRREEVARLRDLHLTALPK